MKNNKSGKWDLNCIYDSPESDNFTNDTLWLKKLMDSFNRKVKTGKMDFSRCISDFNLISDLMQTLDAYTTALFTVNTSDKSAISAVNKVESLSTEYKVCSSLFYKFVASKKNECAQFIKSHCEYAFVLTEITTKSKHSLSGELEKLSSELIKDGSNAFSRLQEAISSSATCEMDGKTLNVSELRAMASDPDRNVRQKAYNAELGIWQTHRIALSYALNSVKGTSITLDSYNGWKTPLEHSCFDSRIDSVILKSLISVLEKNLPMLRSYLKAKAGLLGLKKIAFYDLFAPVCTEGHKLKYSLADAKKTVIENYSLFNPEMGAFAENAFSGGWIDAYPATNKVGGAYDIYIPKIRESRILANFDGSYDGVSTFAHELGHAWHDKIVSSKPYLLRNYPMTLAETASVFAEYIVFNGVLNTVPDEEKIIILEQFLQNACQLCVDILCRYYFENRLFEKRKEGELLPDELCSIMVDCQKKTYGNVMDYKLLHPYMWAVKSHYYSTDLYFYNYPYAFGLLFGLGLYQHSRGKDMHGDFHNKFNSLLENTGTMSAKDVALSEGINLEDESFWQEGMDLISEYVKLFRKLAGNLKNGNLKNANPKKGNPKKANLKKSKS